MPRSVSKKARALAVAGFVVCLALGAGGEARASGPLGPQGSVIGTSAYDLEAFQGPILASSRITGMGGAYTAIAEGADGIPFNPAAASLRSPYSTTRDDWDITGGVTFPSSIEGTDFDNNGQKGLTYDSFVWGSLGGYVQHDHLGIGVILSGQFYELGNPGGSTVLPNGSRLKSLSLDVVRADIVASYGFLDEQLHVGLGMRNNVFQATSELTDGNLFVSNGYGLQGGVLWAPKTLPLRLGLAARSPLLSYVDPESQIQEDHGDRRAGDFYLPSKVSLPWEIEWGSAFQIGRRPLNMPWYDEDKVPEEEADKERRTVKGMLEPRYRGARRLLRRRYRAIARQRLLVAFSALLTGPSSNAVGFESMLSQIVDRTGERATLTLRAGAEGEVISDRLVLRAGSYMEPTRFRESSPRVHGTTGFDVRLLDTSFFGLLSDDLGIRLTAAVDGARDYFGWSLGLGMWH